MFTYPFQILLKRLQSNIPELREVDWYLGQDSETDKNAMVVAAPAVYIEFLPSQMQDLGKRIQLAESDFNLHLITSNVQDSGGKRVSKDHPGNHMVLLDKVFKFTHGFSAKISYLPAFAALLDTDDDQRIMNTCSRSQISPPHRIRKGLMKSTQTFKTTLYDYAAQGLVQSASANLDLTIELD